MPHDSFLRSEAGAAYLCVAGLKGFGELAIGADVLVNPVPIETWPGEDSGGPGGALPDAFALSAAHPNPFSGTTTLRLDGLSTGRVAVAVYDLLGREVAVLADGPMAAGTHRLVFDGRGLPSGVYLVRMVAGNFVATQRVTLLR